MARIGWKIVMLASSLVLGGCGDDDDTGDTQAPDQAEYGVEAILWLPAESEPLPSSWEVDSSHSA